MAVNNMRNLQMYIHNVVCGIIRNTGWMPAHNLEAGLTKTYKIMKSYYKN